MGVFRKITSLLSPSKATVSFTDAEITMQKELKLTDPGAFTYEEDGFFYAFIAETRKINWADIVEIVAYKQDIFTANEICLDITYQDWMTTFTQETPGWYVFIKKLKAVFPEIPENWVEDVSDPAFATNLTLYERG